MYNEIAMWCVGKKLLCDVQWNCYVMCRKEIAIWCTVKLLCDVRWNGYVMCREEIAMWCVIQCENNIIVIWCEMAILLCNVRGQNYFMWYAMVTIWCDVRFWNNMWILLWWHYYVFMLMKWFYNWNVMNIINNKYSLYIYLVISIRKFGTFR